MVDVSPEQVRSEPHAVGTWRFAGRDAVPLDGKDDLDALEQWLAAQPDKARTLLRLGFRGTLDLAGAARLERLLEDARDLFAALVEREGDLAIVPDDADFSDLALSGFAATAVERLRAEVAADGAQAATARDALALLVRLSSGQDSGLVSGTARDAEVAS